MGCCMSRVKKPPVYNNMEDAVAAAVKAALAEAEQKRQAGKTGSTAGAPRVVVAKTTAHVSSLAGADIGEAVAAAVAAARAQQAGAGTSGGQASASPGGAAAGPDAAAANLVDVVLRAVGEAGFVDGVRPLPSGATSYVEVVLGEPVRVGTTTKTTSYATSFNKPQKYGQPPRKRHLPHLPKQQPQEGAKQEEQAAHAAPAAGSGQEWRVTGAGDACGVCTEPAELCVLQPCGHRAACAACARRLQDNGRACPVCKAVVTGDAP